MCSFQTVDKIFVTDHILNWFPRFPQVIAWIQKWVFQSFHLNFELASFAHDDDDNVDGGGSGGGGGGGSDDENYGDLPTIPKKRQKSLPPNVSAAKFP